MAAGSLCQPLHKVILFHNEMSLSPLESATSQQRLLDLLVCRLHHFEYTKYQHSLLCQCWIILRIMC